jgi:NAD-dependent DNA ligase|nr:MAG TPA: DNA ligase [Caudoviricetes sp.]
MLIHQKELEEKIVEANRLYREGNPIMSDKEYDSMKEGLEKYFPDSDILKKSIVEESVKGDRMEKLPYPMFSLEKVKTVDEIVRWTKDVWGLSSNDRIVITPKYDGISLLVDETTNDCWTRGDGTEGQNSRDHYRYVNHGNPMNKKGCFTFGEAIIPIGMFLKNVKPLGYKSARNAVAGAFNADDFNAQVLGNTAYIRYGIMDSDRDKSMQLAELYNDYDPYATQYWVTSAGVFDDEKTALTYLNDLFESIKNFKCDGLVIEVDNKTKREELGRLPNGNPRYAIAYKNPDWQERYTTKVQKIEWSVSKDGKAKPVIVFSPVEFDGATVSRCTGYNAKYITDNHISPNAYIVVSRSGDVIPKHLETVSYSVELFREMCDGMMICPSCGEPLRWDANLTDLVCVNPNCDEKAVKQLVYFFATLGTEEMQEATVRKLYKGGLLSVENIVNATEKELEKIEGIGKSLSKKLRKQFDSYVDDGVPFARILTAYNVFGGVIGEKTCQMIFNSLSKDQIDYMFENGEVPLKDLLSIDGIAETTAKAFNDGLKLFFYLCSGTPVSISFIQEETVENDNPESVCFTGFRNKQWEERLVKEGHKVVSGVSKNTTILVTKDKESSSSKVKKAKDLNIPILTPEEFEIKIGWKEI